MFACIYVNAYVVVCTCMNMYVYAWVVCGKVCECTTLYICVIYVYLYVGDYISAFIEVFENVYDVIIQST